MKRLRILVVACIFAVILLGSCAGSKKTCPAYGKANTEQQDVKC